MNNNNNHRELLIERLSTELDDLPLEQSEEHGYRLLIAGLRILTDESGNENLTSSEISECITDSAWGFPNRRGDEGLDAYWVDDVEKNVYFIQSKHQGTIERQEMVDFLQLPKNLLTTSLSETTANNTLKEGILDIKEALLTQQYDIKLYFFSSGNKTKRIENIANRWNEDELELFIDGTNNIYNHEALIWDYETILNKLDLYSSTSPQVATFNIIHNEYVEKEIQGKKDLLTYLSAKQLVELFRASRWNLFKDNPRSFLGNRQNTNQTIKNTLNESDAKSIFHRLNNGINITCESYELEVMPISPLHEGPQNQKLTIQDIQIVNGLQTTYTLYDFFINQRNTTALDNVYIKATIAEVYSADERKKISLTSNNQSPVTGWDFASLDPVQIKIQKEINDTHSNEFNYFYELEYYKL